MPSLPGSPQASEQGRGRLTNLCDSKPSGIRAGRKLRNSRRENKWADKGYKKKHLGTEFKSNPFGGASHAKGIVLEKLG
eukprot:CAMPEP_0114611284 /NCGR_PEP_ID=MMETSP0168-20121206/4032_1 /TAXON_ID=95228 ORGANISM="Vannella sp., Strain DIVA3 517/6/12" /NCGR_SAMPLE_ID=MMETSP0168 /ASSEMBLY_ACC=CAM_ASM_000044 /LENGTH=78 /DNA_ID=CAMNT_0001822243 /DNA_START=241 /DNA_END=474 /DNA_ORIENTATION=+